LIEAVDLTKSYGEVEALAGVRFTIPAGQVCGLLGPNGAGKSTTIKLLAGIIPPTSGAARIAGHDVVERPLEAKAALGYVPEGGGLYTLLTPREHLALVADLHEVPPADAA
jgi:ABC-2 type transport system ATP-binding protein